jgi:hypothetical protein
MGRTEGAWYRQSKKHGLLNVNSRANADSQC